MSQKGAESLINLLLELLERHPDGLRSDQIRTAFGRQGLNFSLADITGTLRGLMEINGIRFQKQRWISVKAKAGDSWVQTAQLPPAKCPRTERSHQTFEHSIPAIFTNNKISAIPFRPIRAKNDTAYDQVPMQSGSLPSDWNLLRSLIPYYRECLRVEERPNMLVGSEKFGERFLALTTAGRWWPEESESVSFTLDAQNLPSGFLKALARRGDDEIFLGYPVSTIPTKDGGTLIQPIFTLNCQIEMKSGGVNILIPSQGPDLNAGWLEKNFKHNSEAQKFLNWIGIRNAGDISDLESSVNDEFVDIGTAAARYRAFVGEEKCDRLIPEAPSLFIKTGIGKALSQNAIILFLSDLTRYSRGAIRELDTLATWDLADLEKSSLRNLFSRKVEKQTGSNGPVLSPIELNEDQLNAVREALIADLTVITGPPGTGKSQTVAAIMASVALDGGNALLASKNHKAIDAIEERLNELTGDRVILARANRQWGSQRAFDLKASVNAMISRNAEPGAYERHRYRLAALKDMESKRWGLHDGLVQRKRLERLIADKYEQISIIRTKFGGKVFDWAQSQETDVGVMELLPKRTWLMNLPIIGAWIRNRRHKAFITRLNNKGIPWTELGFERIGPEHIVSIAVTIEKLMECRRLQVEVSSLNRDLEKLPETEDTLDRLMTLNQEIMNHSSELFKELPNVLDELTEFEKQEMVEFKGSVSVLDSKDASVALQANKLWSRAMPQSFSNIFPFGPLQIYLPQAVYLSKQRCLIM